MTRINLVDEKGNPTQLWENLRLHVLHSKGPMDHLYAKIREVVAGYGGTSNFREKYISFEDEKNASWFVLNFF
jgi:hypothetical protein